MAVFANTQVAGASDWISKTVKVGRHCGTLVALTQKYTYTTMPAYEVSDFSLQAPEIAVHYGFGVYSPSDPVLFPLLLLPVMLMIHDRQ
jgi:hypothetical protein